MGAVSIPPWPDDDDAMSRPSVSTPSPRTSISGLLIDNFPILPRSITSSSEWDKSATAASPITPDMPFKVWAARNSAFKVSGATDDGSGERSMSRRFWWSVSSSSSDSARNSWSVSSCRRPDLFSALADLPDGSPQEVRFEGFLNVGRGAEIEPLSDVVLAALGRHDDQRDRLVLGMVLDEVHDLEPIDVRHIDVGDDQIERLLR